MPLPPSTERSAYLQFDDDVDELESRMRLVSAVRPRRCFSHSLLMLYGDGHIFDLLIIFIVVVDDIKDDNGGDSNARGTRARASGVSTRTPRTDRTSSCSPLFARFWGLIIVCCFTVSRALARLRLVVAILSYCA